jgi:glycosyltransferase involved in cell wall biosynthesis
MFEGRLPEMQHQSEGLSGVSVIIPVYNRAKTLLGTLPYVAAQTVQPEQLVIVDDGSTDDSAEAAQCWLAAHAPALGAQVIRTPHNGAAVARNVGLRAMQPTPYVAFLDSDDHWPADFLERTSRLLWQNRAAVAASVDRRFLNEDRITVEQDDCSELAKDPITWMFYRGAGLASCSLFRLDVVNQAGNWSESLILAEDLKLFVEIAQHGEWLHSPGLPVEFDLGYAATCGEEGNLSQRYDSQHWQWICVYEQIYQELCDRRVPIDRGSLQKAIAIVWNRAGKRLQTLGRRSEAKDCFVNSIRWKPTQLRAWRRLALNTVLPSNVLGDTPA